MSEELCTRTGNRRWFEISQKIEQVVKAQKKLNANVDFYSATTYYALGIPVDLFTPVFAVSRISGWTAHVLEQYANNRLIRPRADTPGRPTRSRSCRSIDDNRGWLWLRLWASHDTISGAAFLRPKPKA